MRAGRLRHRVTIQTYQTTRDAYGAEIKDWIDGPTIWASVEPINGREYFAAAQANAETSVRIRCRYRADLASATGTTHRLAYQGRVYKIDSVIDRDMRHIQLEVMCHERL